MVNKEVKMVEMVEMAVGKVVAEEGVDLEVKEMVEEMDQKSNTV